MCPPRCSVQAEPSMKNVPYSMNVMSYAHSVGALKT